MKNVYTKMTKHNREENIMKGFIEVMNQIIDNCRRRDDCQGCPFLEIHAKYTACYWQKTPENFESLDIIRRLQAHD